MNLGEEEEDEEEVGDEELGTLLLSLFSLSLYLSVPSSFSRRNLFILLIFVRKRGKLFLALLIPRSPPRLPCIFFEWKRKKRLKSGGNLCLRISP